MLWCAVNLAGSEMTMGSIPAAGFSKAKNLPYMFSYLNIMCHLFIKKMWLSSTCRNLVKHKSWSCSYLNTITFQSGVTMTLKTVNQPCNSLQALILLFLAGYTQTPIVNVCNSGNFKVAGSLPAICFVFFLFFLQPFLFRQAGFWQLHALAQVKCECVRLIRGGGRAGMCSWMDARYQLGPCTTHDRCEKWDQSQYGSILFSSILFYSFTAANTPRVFMDSSSFQ